MTSLKCEYPEIITVLEYVPLLNNILLVLIKYVSYFYKFNACKVLQNYGNEIFSKDFIKI